MDSFFLKPLDYTHLKYDYIGAPWCLLTNIPAREEYEAGHIAAENMISVGNGGFSLRNPAAMLRCITEYIPTLHVTSDYAEDILFVRYYNTWICLYDGNNICVFQMYEGIEYEHCPSCSCITICIGSPVQFI